MRLPGAQPFREIDSDTLWPNLQVAGDVPEQFGLEVRWALANLRPQPPVSPPGTSQERKRIYDRVTNALRRSISILSDEQERLSAEFGEVGMDFEPEDFVLTIPDSYEGLSYDEAIAHQIIDLSEEYIRIIEAATIEHAKPRGRAKTNDPLELTIKALGEVYVTYAQRDPMQGYGYSPTGGVQKFTGPFMDFIYAAIWMANGREVPTGDAIGDAARRVFGLRK